MFCVYIYLNMIESATRNTKNNKNAVILLKYVVIIIINISLQQERAIYFG